MSDEGNPGNQRRPPMEDPLSLLNHYECPVCLDYALPPIPQCANGHIICTGCRRRVSTCPTCRTPMSSEIRNLTLEKLVDHVVFPCKFTVNGCNATMLHLEKLEHEAMCKFGLFACPTPDTSCKWLGSLPSLFEHLTSHNPPVTFIEGPKVKLMATEVNRPDAGFWVMLQSCYNTHFVTVLERIRFNNRDTFYAFIKVLGIRSQALKYSCRIELKGDARKLLWMGTPHTMNDSMADMKKDCLTFDSAAVQNFSEGENLALTVQIVQKKK